MDDGSLILETTKATQVEIISISGSIVAQKRVEGRASFALPKGIYIIKTKGKIIKAVVK